MQAIKRFLLENANPLEILGIDRCPHCKAELDQEKVTTKEQNGTYYYYHLNCGDSRPIGSMPSNNSDMLRSLWTHSKTCNNPQDQAEYHTNKDRLL